MSELPKESGNTCSTELSLSHFSPEPYLRHLYSREQEVRNHRSCFEKPCGLWVSVDGEDDWPTWCEGAEFGIARFRHQVYLQPDAAVLYIRSASELRDFRRKWGRETERFNDIYIPWEDIAKVYQGIIIAPYQWTCRMNENWYYTWDCASGCIWDVSAIACVEPLREAA